MKFNKFLIGALTAGVIAFTTESCRKIEEDGQVVIQQGTGGTTPTENTVIGSSTSGFTEITSDMTLKSGNTYTLRGIIFVKNNATLTIEPGTKIVGADEKSGLVITRGAKIKAEGTATNPIVFTSSKASPKRGDWAGVILLGNAPTNSSYNNQAGVGQIEGVPVGKIEDQLYGGTNPDDNSGILKYVRIEYAGYAFLPDKEINGLTFGGVGRGTTVDYVQVSYANDDSFEWFGGTVNCKHLIAYKGLDDDFDTDNGYSGNVQFGIGVRDPQVADISGSNGFESDNDANGSTLAPQTSAVFVNMTMVGPLYNGADPATVNSLHQNGAQIRRNSSMSLFNSLIMGYKDSGIFIDGTKGKSTDTNITGGTLVLANNIIAGCPTNPLKFAGASGYTAYDIDKLTAYFTANGNSMLPKATDVKLTGPWNPAGTTPNFSPASGSPLLTGGAFTDPKLNNPFFEKVTYRGAVKDANDFWYTGWTSFNL